MLDRKMCKQQKNKRPKCKQTANFSCWVKCMILLLLAAFSMRCAFTANHYDDAVAGWCISIGLIIAVIILIFSKTSKSAKIKTLTVLVILFLDLSIIQVLAFRFNCEIINENTMYYKCETLYHMVNNSVITENNGSKYIYLQIGAQRNIKSYLYKSKNDNFKIIKTNEQIAPYLDCRIYERISKLSYCGDKHDTLYLTSMINPMVRRLIQIKNADDYCYKIVNLKLY